MKKIRIGQIGTAHGHATGKLEVFRKSPDYEVIGIVEPDPVLRQQAEASEVYRDLPWMTVDQLLGVADLQLVAIETAPGQLLDHAEQCVDAGMHIHLDKPAGESLNQFRRILDQASRRHLTVQMGYMYRYHPGVVLLRNLLRKGFLGDPFELHAVMSKLVDQTSRRKLAAYQGGMMFELGCHLIDVIIDLLGPPESVESIARHSGSQNDKLQDNMLAVLGYRKGIATVKSSALEVDGGARRHLVLCGTEGTFQLEPLDSPKVVRLTLAKERGKYRQGFQEVALPPFQRYVGDLADLAKVIRGEKILEWSPIHDLLVQETVLKASGCPTDV